MGKMKFYTSGNVLDEFNKKSKSRKIEILFDALHLMQQYNGRSETYCIAMAMGYLNYEGKPNTYIKV